MSLARKLAATAALLTVVALPAHAQFGSIMGHIKDKAAEKANKKIDEKIDGKKDDPQQQGSGPGAYRTTGGCTPPTFGPGNIELNADGVSKVLKAFQALHDAGEKNGRNALEARLESDKARLQELEEDPAISEAQDSEHEYQRCQAEGFAQVIQKNLQAKGGGMGWSVEYQKAMREHQEKIAAAEQKGDTATAKALQDSTLLVWQKVWAPTAADSAEVLKKCGKPPRVSRKVAERDSLRVTVREEADSVRGLDEDAEDAVRAASGLTGRQFATARERLQMYLSMGTPCGYTTAEVDAIEAKKGELQKLINGK